MGVDYYKVLGVGHGATNDKLKKAYRHFGMKYHPTRTPPHRPTPSSSRSPKPTTSVHRLISSSSISSTTSTRN